MTYTEAYLRNKGFNSDEAAALLTSPMGVMLAEWVDKSITLGQSELLNAYDTNIAHTLRGELRTLSALKQMLAITKAFSEKKLEVPPELEGAPDLTDPGFAEFKEPTKIK